MLCIYFLNGKGRWYFKLREPAGKIDFAYRFCFGAGKILEKNAIIIYCKLNPPIEIRNSSIKKMKKIGWGIYQKGRRGLKKEDL